MGAILTIVLIAAPFLLYDWWKEWDARETAKARRIVEDHFKKGEFFASDGAKIDCDRWRINDSLSSQIMNYISTGRASKIKSAYAVIYKRGICLIRDSFDRTAEVRDGALFAYKLSSFEEIEFLDFDEFLSMRPATASAVVSAMLPDAVEAVARAVCRRVAENCQMLNLCGRPASVESRCLR